MAAETAKQATPHVACVVPAYDAAPTLGGVVTALRAALRSRSPVDVIIVDDGSRDATSEIATASADHVIRWARNRGKGAALRAGFAAARERGATVVLTADADGQHDASYAPRLVAALAAADLALGVRTRRRTSMPWVRQVSNSVSAAATRVCAGSRWPDSQCGFRAFRTGILDRIAPRGDRYEYETDFLIQAARAGVRITCVEVPTLYGARSHFRPVKDSVRIVAVLARGLVARGAAYRP